MVGWTALGSLDIELVEYVIKQNYNLEIMKCVVFSLGNSTQSRA